jgi:hypothetical protein
LPRQGLQQVDAYPPARLTNQEAIEPVPQARAQQVANGDRRHVALRTTGFELQLTGRIHAQLAVSSIRIS